MAAPPEDLDYEMAHITDDRGPLVIGVTSMLLGLATVAICLRFGARIDRRLKLSWDDWLALVGYVCLILETAVNIISVHYGLGKHSVAVNPQTAYIINEAGLYYAILYCLGQWFIKASILLFYRRIFTTNIAWFRWAIWGWLGFTSCWAITGIFGAIFQCYFYEQYNPSLNPPAKGYCGLDNHAFVVGMAVMNTIGDFVILFLPMAMLWRLQLKRTRKILLVAVFATGTLACIAGIMRLHITQIANKPGADVTWAITDVYLWTQVEAAIGLICACLPIISPLVGKVGEKTRSYFSKLSSRGSSQYPDGSQWSMGARGYNPNGSGAPSSTVAKPDPENDGHMRTFLVEGEKFEPHALTAPAHIMRTHEIHLEHSRD